MIYSTIEGGDDDVGGDLYSGGRSAGGADFCSREGAQILKQKIESYWRERGYRVQIQLHNVGFHPAIRAARYDVRSDMINGLPRASAGGPANATRQAGED